MDILASLEIRRVSGSELPQRLLLAADESREAVADYVDRGWCYGAFLAGRMVGEYVLLHTRPFTAVRSPGNTYCSTPAPSRPRW